MRWYRGYVSGTPKRQNRFSRRQSIDATRAAMRGRQQPKRLESRHTDQWQASTRNPLAYGRSFRYHTPALIRAYSSVG